MVFHCAPASRRTVPPCPGDRTPMYERQRADSRHRGGRLTPACDQRKSTPRDHRELVREVTYRAVRLNYTECVQRDKVPGLRKVVEAVGKGFVHLRCCAVG